jgi:RND family efflux transporter MFP subunit
MRLVKLEEATPTPPSAPAQPPRHHGRPWLVGVLAALAVVALGTAIDYWLHARLVPPPLVFLAPVTRGPVAARLSLTGILEPTETRAVTQPMAGRATEVAVRAGDAVVVGQVVARFDPIAQRAEVARAESRLVAAEADAFRAELVLARMAQRADEDQDADAAAVAQARLATANAEIEARTAAYRAAAQGLRDRMIRAPLAGVILERRVEPGQTVGAGETLLVIGANPRRLRLVAEAPEAALAQVSAGQSARFTVPALPGRVFAARLTQGGPLRGPRGARHFPVLLDVANDDGTLAVGMSAAVEIDTGRAGPVYRVPVAALSFSPAGQQAGEVAIWVGDARGNGLVRTRVELGASDTTFVEIRGAGIREGDMVAVGFGRAPERRRIP